MIPLGLPEKIRNPSETHPLKNDPKCTPSTPLISWLSANKELRLELPLFTTFSFPGHGLTSLEYSAGIISRGDCFY